MTQRDEELGLPGNREVLERALRESTTQVLHLAPETGPRNRTLAERGADLVRGFERVPADARPARHDEPEIPVPAPEEIHAAEEQLTAVSELAAILAEQRVS
jgi:hypothetical protein